MEADPSRLSLPLENIERWLASGRLHPAPLTEWKSRLEAASKEPGAWAALIAWMRADNYDEEPLKSCSPFPGLLSRRELLDLAEED